MATMTEYVMVARMTLEPPGPPAKTAVARWHLAEITDLGVVCSLSVCRGAKVDGPTLPLLEWDQVGSLQCHECEEFAGDAVRSQLNSQQNGEREATAVR